MDLDFDNVISPQETAAILGISITTLWRLRRDGCFPPEIHLSARRIGWRTSAIRAYMDSRTGGCS